MDDRHDPALVAFFDSEYQQEWTIIARYRLLDEATGCRELVTAEVSSNGNEYAVRAWTYVRSERELERNTLRVLSTQLDGEHLLFSGLVDLADIQVPSAVPVSETLARMLIRQAKIDTGWQS